MSHSNEIQMITPPHLNFVLSILTNDLIQSEIDRVSHFFLSFRPEGLTPKESSSDAMPILYCTAARRAARWCRLSLQTLHLLTPPSNSNGLRIIFVFSRYLQRRRKLNLYFNWINRRSFSKEAKSSHHCQSSSELELRSFWVDRTELIKFIHERFHHPTVAHRCLFGHAQSRFR